MDLNGYLPIQHVGTIAYHAYKVNPYGQEVLVDNYMARSLYAHPYVGDDTRCLSFVYAPELANALGETAEASKIHTAILNLLPKLSYEPILYSQVALHFLDWGEGNAALLVKAEGFSNAVLREYDQKLLDKSRLEVARFPELIPILHTIGDIRGNKEITQKSEAISEWYISQQLSDESFPNTVGSGSPYVRGSGKIFEVSCLEPEKNKASVEWTVNWLSEALGMTT